MSHDEPDEPDERQDSADRPEDAAFLDRLHAALREQVDALPDGRRSGFVSSDLAVVDRALAQVIHRDLPRGPVFCEWGSGLGAVCALAARRGLEAHGLEIQAELVEGGRHLLETLGLEANLAHGSFLRPGDDDLVADCPYTVPDTAGDGWAELGLDPAAADLVFAFPWPGEEAFHDELFRRHTTPGALLLTFHEHSRVLVQRHEPDADELLPLGWFGDADDD